MSEVDNALTALYIQFISQLKANQLFNKRYFQNKKN